MRSICFSRSLARSCGAALVLAGVLGSAHADVRYLYSVLDGAQEVPPVPTAGTGEGLYVLDDALSVLHYEITYQNLGSAETQAHLHGPAPVGANAGILHNLPLGTPKIGVWFLTATQVGHLLNELVYANIHTAMFGGGELRGQLEVIGRGFCFGDGGGTPCPCGNSDGAHAGCRNTTGQGARLRPAGLDLIGLRMIGDGLVPGTPALLFRGTFAINGGNGVTFGDGLRCVGGGVVRLGVRSPDASGRAEWGPNLNVPNGSFLQVWYRDPSGGGVCGNSSNLSNGVELQL